MKKVLKCIIKSIVLSIDHVLIPLLLPVILHWKGVKYIHLSFDDVPFRIIDMGEAVRKPYKPTGW